MNNQQIMNKAEEDIYEILNGATIKIKDRPPEIIIQSIGGQLFSTKLSELDKHKKLKLRESDHLDPTNVKTKDFIFPPSTNLSFDNYIIGFIHKPGRWNGVNIIMSNGTRSTLAQNSSYGNQPWQEVRIHPPNAIVKRVVMHGNY